MSSTPYYSQILMKREFFDRFSRKKNTQISNLVKIAQWEPSFFMWTDSRPTWRSRYSLFAIFRSRLKPHYLSVKYTFGMGHPVRVWILWYEVSRHVTFCARGVVHRAYSVRAERQQLGMRWCLILSRHSKKSFIWLKSNTDEGHICCDASKYSCRLTEWHGNWGRQGFIISHSTYLLIYLLHGAESFLRG